MGTSYEAKTSIRFGVYELDLKAGVLRKNGIRIRCQEQPFQVLAALAERPGELVTREELCRRLWPEDTFVDFDHALNTAIKKVRSALNDDADTPRYIETVPRRGYRFVAAIEEEPTPPAQPTLQQPLPAPPARAKRLGFIAMASVAAIALAILGFSWRFAPSRGDASTSPEFQRLTFDLPELGDARFTPDGASVVYAAGWYPHKGNLYTQRLGAPGPQLLGITTSMLLSISRQAELAILGTASDAQPPMTDVEMSGTLARVPLNGGAPRELLADAEAADWSPSGELAVVRRAGERSRLEFPVGKVLYETSGWIGTPRFSPRGDAIAFLDHPIVPDDRGSVAIVDLNGNKRTVSGFWESLRGLAWSPRGDELWFAATRSGLARALYAATLNGRERRILTVPGGLTLRDISHDGRVLLSRDHEREGIMFVGAGETKPRELSWEDYSMVTDISSDGKRILFGAEGENSGLSYQVGLRLTDGSAPVMLGSGEAQSLSPDGKWAISTMPPPNDQLLLLPTGAGSPKTLERGAVEHYLYAGAKWFPDGSEIVLVGYEAGHGPRCYVQSVEGGKPRAFSPDGTVFCSVSPAGQILAFTQDSRVLLYRSESSDQPEKEIKLEQGEMPRGWTADGKSLYLVRTVKDSVTITRLEIESGRRTPWKQIPQPLGSAKCEAVVITPDGQSYAYTYSSHTSDLYLVEGVK